MDEDDVTRMVVVGGLSLSIGLAYTLYGLWRRFVKSQFITDEHGERQRVIAWNRGQPVYDPKTWQQRIHEEAVLKGKRRFRLFFSFGVLAAWIGAAVWVSQYGSIFGGMMIWGGMLGILQLLVLGVPALLQEIAYQTGYQGMQGAKVLDKRPPRPPGREVVEQQKAHGDARVAGEAEALSLLRSKR